MLQVATLLLLALAGQETLTLQGELKDVPPQGKDGPALLCEGTTNLPNNSALVAHLYYGKPVGGREIFKDTAIVKGGKFSQYFPVFERRNFPGLYSVRLIYDPQLQNLGAPDFPHTAVEYTLQIGTAADVDAEGKAVRGQLIAEIRALIAIADQMKSKHEGLREKPQAEREAPAKAWQQELLEIRKRASPRSHPEYFILNLDFIADSGFEDLGSILSSCARCFVLNQHEKMTEGLTRLRQTGEYWIGEIANPRLSDLGQMASHIEECRKILRKLLDNPDEPLKPARTRYLEITALLDKSVPPDFHEVILGATSRGAAFFAAVADKSPDLKQIHADLDGLLERFAGTLRNSK